MSDRKPVNFTSTFIRMKSHDANLQTLNRENNGYFQPLEAFTGTEEAWNKVPLLFGPEHPDFDAFDSDPDHELVLAECGIRHVKGHLEMTRIEVTGHPMLRAKIVLENEAELEGYIDRGVLSLSTGYRAEAVLNEETFEMVIQGPVEPHHVLLFIEYKRNRPGDKGSGIVNKLSEKKDQLITKFTAMLTNLLTKEDEAQGPQTGQPEPVLNTANSPVPQTDNSTASESVKLQEEIESSDNEIVKLKAELGNLQTKYSKLETSLEVSITEKDGMVKNIETLTNTDKETQAKLEEAQKAFELSESQKKILEDKIREYEAREENREWESFKANIPPGMLHGEGAEEAVRKMWKDEPAKLASEIMTHKDRLKEQPAEGNEHTAVKTPRRNRARGVQTYSFNGQAFVPDPVEE